MYQLLQSHMSIFITVDIVRHRHRLPGIVPVANRMQYTNYALLSLTSGVDDLIASSTKRRFSPGLFVRARQDASAQAGGNHECPRRQAIEAHRKFLHYHNSRLQLYMFASPDVLFEI